MNIIHVLVLAGVSDPLELELHIIVIHHVGAGNLIQVLPKSNVCS